MRRILGVLILFLLAPFCVSAQANRSTDQGEVVKALLARIDKLEKRLVDMDRLEARIAELETNRDLARPLQAAETERVPELVPASLATAALDHQPSAPAENHPALPQEANQSEPRFPSLHIRGFTDINFAATDEPGTSSGFNLGQFVLHMTSPLSKKITYFGEISFTAQPTGYNLDVERSLIRYDYNDYFKISFGRYHTPINYWNTAFHHGLWLQTTISRPEMIRFGGRFQPVHFVGMLAEGNVPSGPLGLGYNVGLGNGRNGTISRAGDSGDINNNRAWVVNLFARPTALNSLQFGGAAYGDKITPSPGLVPGNPTFAELITTAHVVWTRETPEVLAEFAHVRHRNQLTNQFFNSQAAYVQIAYRLPGEARRWKPYYRFEWTNRSGSDPLFVVSDPTVAVRPLNGNTVGVRYDISNLAAFKWEYRHTSRAPSDPRVNGIFIQTSFTF